MHWTFEMKLRALSLYFLENKTLKEVERIMDLKLGQADRMISNLRKTGLAIPTKMKPRSVKSSVHSKSKSPEELSSPISTASTYRKVRSKRRGVRTTTASSNPLKLPVKPYQP